MAREERWNHHGLWGYVPSSENTRLKEAREAVESGRLSKRANQAQITYARTYELARKLGMNTEAEMIESKMARVMESESRRTQKRPQKVGDLYVKKYHWNGERVVCYSHNEDDCHTMAQQKW